MLKVSSLRSIARTRSTAWLGFIAGINLVVYLFAFTYPARLVDLYGRVKPDFFAVHPVGSAVHILVVIAFVLLGFLYLLGWVFALEAEGQAAWAVVIAGTVVFAAALLFLFPYDAADIFDYIIHGRMTAIYASNPYRSVPSDFPNDPFYPYVAWKSAPSPYGPIWEILAGAAARLAGDREIAAILAFKLVVGVFFLGSVLLVGLILKKIAPGRVLPGVLLLAWNPVVLYEALGNGHNDMVMIFWVLAAVLAAVHRKFTLMFLFLTAGALVKFIPALLFPPALVIALSAHDSIRSRLSFLARTGAACLVLAAVLYAPFWFGPDSITVLDRTTLFTASIPAMVYYFLDANLLSDPSRMVSLTAFGLTILFTVVHASRFGRQAAGYPLRIPGQTPLPVGLPATGMPPSTAGALETAGAGLVFASAAFNILAFYLLVTCLWFQQWYTVWLIALAPLIASRPLRWFAIFFGFAALNKQFGMGALLYYPIVLEQPGLEIVFTIGVMGLPWLAAVFAYRRQAQVSRSKQI